MSVRLQGGHANTVLSIAINQAGSGRIVSGGEEGELCLWAPDGSIIQKRQLIDGNDVTSLCWSRLKPDVLYVSSGENIHIIDTRQFQQNTDSFSFNEEEINQLTLNDKETFLAACDDSGNIRIVNLQEKKVYKTLRKHTNICATVTFRPRRPWDLLTGGLDSKLIQWDFSRGRSVCIIDMTEIGTDVESDSYLINPPLVHSIAVSPDGHYLACGLENATIQIFNSSQRNLAFATSLKAHNYGVSQVHFPEYGQNILVSGGNDGKVLLWKLGGVSENSALCNGVSSHNGAAAAAAPASSGHVIRPIVDLNHRNKVNWLASGQTANQKLIAVADNTDTPVIYPFPDM